MSTRRRTKAQEFLEMSDDELAQWLYDFIVKSAQKIVRLHGEEQSPMILAMRKDGDLGIFDIGMLFDETLNRRTGHMGKNMAAAFHSEVASSEGCLAAALVTEVWMVVGNEKAAREAERSGKSLGEVPGRQEVLMVNIRLKSGAQRLATSVIDRKVGAIERSAPLNPHGDKDRPFMAEGRFIARPERKDMH